MSLTKAPCCGLEHVCHATALFVVAYFIPHNDGVQGGIINDPGFDSGLSLVDLYEVDGSIESFDDHEQAEAWLKKKFAGDNCAHCGALIEERDLDNGDGVIAVHVNGAIYCYDDDQGDRAEAPEDPSIVIEDVPGGVLYSIASDE